MFRDCEGVAESEPGIHSRSGFKTVYTWIMSMTWVRPISSHGSVASFVDVLSNKHLFRKIASHMEGENVFNAP